MTPRRRRIEANLEHARRIREAGGMELDPAAELARWKRVAGASAESAWTARRQVPALHKALLAAEVWQEGDVNVDIGGGPYQDATRTLRRAGVDSFVFDPFNRKDAHNRRVLARLGGEVVLTATVANFLNVVPTAEARADVVQLAARTAGTAFFSVHEGDKSGTGGETRDGWQANLPIDAYLPELRASFNAVSVVTVEGVKLLEASRPAWTEDGGARRRPDDVAGDALTLGTLAADPVNPRHIDPAARAGLAASMDAFGDISGIVWNERTGHLVAGHQRVSELRARYGDDLALDTERGGFVAGDSFWPVRIVDWPEDLARAALMAANSPHIAGEWTDGAADLLVGLDAGEGVGSDLFGDLRLDELLADLTPTTRGPGAGSKPDGPPPLPVEAASRLGEEYELGPHRLVCGDARDRVLWSTLLAGDGGAHLVWTDPPYGIDYVGKTADALTLANDDEAGLEDLLGAVFPLALEHTRPGGAWYVAAPQGPPLEPFLSWLNRAKVLRQILTWVKDRFVLGGSDFHYRHELILYGWHPGAARLHPNLDRTLDTVLEVARPAASPDHPTMKPVELIQRCIVPSSSPGDVVVDPFAGSGSTLIAAAADGRRARLLELDPRYCDVIRRRWTAWATEMGEAVGAGGLV